MVTPAKVVVIDKQNTTFKLLELMSEQLDISLSMMPVNKDTQPQSVASFVQDEMPKLILLAENYQNVSSARSLDIENVKIGEGIEALIEIKKIGVSAPVCMISSSSRHYDRAMQEGAIDYLPVTSDLEVLRQFIEYRLS